MHSPPMHSASSRNPIAPALAAALVALVSLAIAGPVAGAPLDRFWPQLRHDSRRSNHSPSTAALANPAIRWRYSLGGKLTAAAGVDADLDGTEDVLTLGGGRVAARTVAGKLLWQSAPLGLVVIAAVRDLDGDAQPEVVVRSGVAAYVLDAVTGQQKWASGPGQFGALQIATVADFTGDGVADLALASAGAWDLSNVPTTRIFSFVQGKFKEVITTANPIAGEPFPFSFGQQFLDVDGDGVTDVLIPGHLKLAAFSGKTGAVIGLSPLLPVLTPFNSMSASVPAADGGAPWLVVGADLSQAPPTQKLVGWYVLRANKGVLQPVWSLVSADAAQESLRLHRSAVGDLDGDGKPELLASRFVQGAWRMQAFDLANGQTLTTSLASDWQEATAAGPVLLGQVLLLGEKLHVVALQVGRQVPVTTPLRLVRWSRAKGFTQVADLGVGAWSELNLKAQDAIEAWQVPVRSTLGLTDGEPAPELLILRDSDGDFRLDRLERLAVAPQTPQTPPVLLAERALSPGTLPVAVVRGPVALQRSPLQAGTGKLGKQPLHLVGTASDGQVSIWNPVLQLVNDLDGDGKADLVQPTSSLPLVIAAPWRDSDATPVLLVSDGDTLRVLDPQGAGPIQPPKLLWSLTPSAGSVRGHLADLDGDGEREVVARFRPAMATGVLQVLDRKAKPLWQWSPPGPLADWGLPLTDSVAIRDLDGDGGDDLLLSLYPVIAGEIPTFVTTVLSGKAHASMWQSGSGGAALTGGLMAVDDTVQPARIMMSVWFSRFAMHATTGAILSTFDGISGTYGQPMLADLDGEAPGDYVLGGSSIMVEADGGSQLKPVWKVVDNRGAGAAASLAMVNGKLLLIQQITNGSGLDARDAKSGALVWSRVYVAGQDYAADAAPAHHSEAAGLVTVHDLTGTGIPAALFRTTEGRLYAASLIDGKVLWSLEFGGVMGDPLPIDVDGDGLLEIVLTLPNGDLVAIDGNVAQAPEWVRENDGTGPALTEAADLDEQEESETLAANWAQAGKANGYAVRLLDDTGGTSVPLADKGPATATQFTGLSLQLGRSYRVAVSSYASSGADQSFSAETLSDGVLIVDKSPPWIEDLRCHPACAVAAGTAVRLQATLRDKTRLASATILGGPGDLAVPVTTWPLAKASAAVDRDLGALPVGPHAVHIKAFDSVGHSAEAVLQVEVCAPGQEPVGDKCVLAGQQQSGSGEATGLYGTRVPGCSSHGAGATWPWWAGLAAAACVIWGRRRKTHTFQ